MGVLEEGEANLAGRTKRMKGQRAIGKEVITLSRSLCFSFCFPIWLNNIISRSQVGELYGKRYKVTKKLGWGHFSTVWMCHDNHTGAYVAMKVFPSSFYTVLGGMRYLWWCVRSKRVHRTILKPPGMK